MKGYLTDRGRDTKAPRHKEKKKGKRGKGISGKKIFTNHFQAFLSFSFYQWVSHGIPVFLDLRVTISHLSGYEKGGKKKEGMHE
jgi:hypothetical protein